MLRRRSSEKTQLFHRWRVPSTKEAPLGPAHVKLVRLRIWPGCRAHGVRDGQLSADSTKFGQRKRGRCVWAGACGRLVAAGTPQSLVRGRLRRRAGLLRRGGAASVPATADARCRRRRPGEVPGKWG